MISILRWFFGWSNFRAEGSVSSFLTKFKRHIWMVKKKDGFIYGRCVTKDFESISEEAKKCGCFLTKCKDHGFLNFAKRFKLRFGILVGILLFFIAMMVSSLFVWDVEVVGNAVVTDEQILKVCDENGLHFAATIFNVNEQDIEHKLKEKFPEISWVSLNRVAGKYIIEISETKGKPNIVEWQGPCDVISKYDGEIVYVEAYSGTPLVEAGNVVKKGDVLVTGAQEMKGMDHFVFSHSDAKIFAKVTRHNETFLKKNSIIEQKTGIKKFEKRLFLFGIKIPLSLNKKQDCVVKSSENYKHLEFLGLRFPVLIQTTTYDVFEKINVKNDVDVIKRLLFKEQKEWEQKELLGNDILSRKYCFEDGEEGVLLKADVVVKQRVDEKAPIKIDITDERVKPQD